MKKKFYIALSILLPLTIAAGNQLGFVEQLIQYLKIHNQNYPQEKVYIQTDKTFYKQNEYIWYKAFLLNSEDNRASEISDVIYVELRDPKGNVVSKHQHNTLGGASSGEFLINEDAAGDDGIAILSVSDLRNAKTTGSKVKAEVKIGGKTVQNIEGLTTNGEARIAFRLPDDLDTSDGLLQIIVNEKGIEESISRSIPIVLNKISLQFFPEGGELIENVQSKVAFEALNEFGKGSDISGKIIDENNVEIAVFESFHLGMGAFEFTPKANKTYKVIIP